MVQYRTFRNPDPPGLVEVWNASITGRGAVHLPSSTPLERYVFSKPFFDPAGLFVAEDDGKVVGFAHAGLGPVSPTGGPRPGVVSALAVLPSHRHHGVGTHLLELAENHLRERGARVLYAGGEWTVNPFYLGVYGGCETPGFLRSDPAAEPFFLAHGYKLDHSIRVMQRSLDQPCKIFDPRFAALRCKFDLRVDYPRKLAGWWQECVVGPVEPLEFLLVDRQTGKPAARTLIWDMEGFGARWNAASVGILEFEVQPTYRRQGLGKLFLSYIMRQIQEQFFQVVEVHLHDKNELAQRFLRALSFEQVDTGQVFIKELPA